nr:MAG TPA: GDSL-like Lipase/Acylhydrolase [Caudoviricetes sp.]
MVYQRHFWKDYDESKTETQNIEDGAVVTTEKLNEMEVGIDSKSDKTYVDAMLSSIAQGGPRELFYSLSALESKYPNGASGTYLVFDSNFMDGAHSYIWNESKWIDLGIYQGLAIADYSVSRKKTNYYNPLFENIITNVEVGFYYSAETGEKIINQDMATSEVLNVEPGMKFEIRNTGLGMSGNESEVYFWRESTSKNGGFIADGSIQVTPNSTKMRVQFLKKYMEEVVLYGESEEYGYVDNLFKIKNENQIGESVVNPEATTFIDKKPNNLFNPKTYIPEYSYNLSGQISSTNGLGSFEFPVTPGQSYEMQWVGFANTAQGNTYITFWDDSKFISSVQAQNFTVPNTTEIKICRIATKINATNPPEIYLADNKSKYVDRSTKFDVSQIENFPSPYAKLSICGDSISTFPGAMVAGNRSYYPKDTVDDWTKTYWGKLVSNRFWLELLVNNSWSGSWVSTGQGNGAPTTSGTMACKYLSSDGVDPDLIILYKGTNDYGGNVTLADFETEYRLMVANTKARYPKAKIFVATILYRTVLPTNENGNTVVDFNTTIKQIAADNGLSVIDFYNCGIDSANASQYLIDGLHPNAAGHDLMYKKAKEQIYDYV